jgi:hypothetical protein
MSRNADVLALMTDTVSVAPFVSNSAYGVATHGTAVSYPCRVEHRIPFIRGADGRTLPIQDVVYVFPTSDGSLPEATPESRVILPGSTSPAPVLATEAFTYDDMNHEVIYCG